MARFLVPLVLVLTVHLAVPPPLWATGYPVFDASNFAQALLQVRVAYDAYAGQLRDYAQQLQQYKELITQTQQQAKHLLKLPLSLVAEVDAVYADYQTLMNQAQGLSQSATQVRAQFQALYDSSATGPTTAAMLNKVRQMAQQQRWANEALAQQTALRERTAQTQRQLAGALAAVKGAEGTLQASQAQSQLVAVMATQQQDMLLLAAASQRSAVAYQAQQHTLEALRQAEAQRLMSDWFTAPVTTLQIDPIHPRGR